jgi:hypothetical protein
MLGGKIASITPTSLTLVIPTLGLAGAGGNDLWGMKSKELIDDYSPIRDLTFTATEPVTIGVSDIESGHYDMIFLKFETESMHLGPKPPAGQPDTRPTIFSKITFDLPGGITDKEAWLNRLYGLYGNSPDKVKLEGGSLTIIPRWLEVDWYDTRNKATPSSPPTRQLQNIVFAGNTRKMALEFYFDELVPDSGYPHEKSGDASKPDNKAMLIVPFSGGVTIPDDANAVRFEVSWDLDGLIEQYKGPDAAANTKDDIFVLKNGWWDGFNIKAVIE